MKSFLLDWLVTTQTHMAIIITTQLYYSNQGTLLIFSSTEDILSCFLFNMKNLKIKKENVLQLKFMIEYCTLEYNSCI